MSTLTKEEIDMALNKLKYLMQEDQIKFELKQIEIDNVHKHSHHKP